MHIFFLPNFIFFFAIIFHSVADSNFGPGAWDASSSILSTSNDESGFAIPDISADGANAWETMVPDPDNGKSSQSLLSASDGCEPGGSQTPGKNRLKRACGDFKPDNKNPPPGDDRKVPGKPPTDIPNVGPTPQLDIPTFSPMIRKTRLEPNEKICPRPFINIPVCDTGKTLLAYPIVPSRFHFDLPSCHPCT